MSSVRSVYVLSPDGFFLHYIVRRTETSTYKILSTQIENVASITLINVVKPSFFDLFMNTETPFSYDHERNW